MLWNSILEFFVKNVFGGYWPDSSGNLVGYGTIFSVTYNEVIYSQNFSGNDIPYGLTFSGYLSLIATIISITIIIWLCCLFVWKIIKLVGGLIR